jgi:peptidoglycan/xylan/chitin deacetylase (PgdA/CDA1 family)
MVALTFDMGGRVEPALDIMNWLIANRVRATIFMTGAMVENPNTDAGREVLHLVAAHPDLFALGNHSYTHPDFRDLTQVAMALELIRTENAIATFVDISPKPYFRPPFGGVNAAVVAGVAAAGYDRTVMWDVDTIDWRPPEEGGPSAADIVAKVTNNAQGGSIVLMHLGGYNTFEALPQLVANLRGKGLEPVTLAELLR